MGCSSFVLRLTKKPANRFMSIKGLKGIFRQNGMMILYEYLLLWEQCHILFIVMHHCHARKKKRNHFLNSFSVLSIVHCSRSVWTLILISIPKLDFSLGQKIIYSYIRKVVCPLKIIYTMLIILAKYIFLTSLADFILINMRHRDLGIYRLISRRSVLCKKHKKHRETVQNRKLNPQTSEKWNDQTSLHPIKKKNQSTNQCFPYIWIHNQDMWD